MQIFTQAIQKSRTRIEFKRVVFPVNFQVNAYRILDTSRCRLFGWTCRRNANQSRSQSHRRACDRELLEEFAASLWIAEGLARFVAVLLVTTG
jgi:hypothetical protein